MKNNIGKLVELYFFNEDDYYVGYIINELEDLILLKSFDAAGEFYDYTLVKKSEVKITKKSKYLEFMKEIIKDNDTAIHFDFISFEGLIQYALKYKKIISFSCHKFYNKMAKPIKLENDIFEYRLLKGVITLMKEQSVSIFDITSMSIDGYELETLGKLINDSETNKTGENNELQ